MKPIICILGLHNDKLVYYKSITVTSQFLFFDPIKCPGEYQRYKCSGCGREVAYITDGQEYRKVDLDYTKRRYENK